VPLSNRFDPLNPWNGHPQIEYDDGDEEEALLCKDKGKLALRMEVGEELPRPSRAELEAQALALHAAAEAQQARAAAERAAAEAGGGQGARRGHRADPKLQRAEDEGGCWSPGAALRGSSAAGLERVGALVGG
jgi:hypothetical protein